MLEPKNKIISGETRELIRKLPLERLSLRGICRATDVSQKWLLDFIKVEYDRSPRDLSVKIPPDSTGLILERLEADEPIRINFLI